MSLFAAGADQLGKGNDAKQVVIGADSLAADGSAGAGAGGQGQQYDDES